MFELTLWALGSLLKGTALLLAVFVVAGVLRTTSAAFRHLVWSGGILAVLILPFVSLALPWRLPVIAVPEAPRQSVELAREPTTGAAVPGVQVEPAAQPVASPPATAGDTRRAATGKLPARRTLALWAIGFWLAGVLFVLGRLAFGAALVRRIVRRASVLETPDWTRPLIEAADRMALDRVPTLLISDRLPIPFACGVVHPTIVLPQAAREWSDRRRRAVLCHELAHIRRLDLPVNALAQLACALYWFHPLVWVATHRLRLESERACDDLVLGVGTRPSEYADHLLQIVCRAARVRAPAMVLPMAERREFEGRMLAILEPDVRRESPTRRHAVTLGAFALAFVLPLAALAPRVIPTPVSPAAGKADETGSRQLERRDVPRTSRTEAATPGSLATSTATVPADADPLVEEPAMKPASDLAPAPQGAGKAQRSREEQSSDTTKAKVVAALVAALSDSVASVREDAVYALGQLEAEAAVGPLTASLTRDASPKVRHMAAWALGQIGSPDGVAGLGLAATKDQSEDVRGMAIWALGQIEDPASVPVLVAVLADASPEMRGRAAWALGTIEPESAPAGLLAALRDAVPSVRLRAAWALGQIEDPAAWAVPGSVDTKFRCSFGIGGTAWRRDGGSVGSSKSRR